MQLECVPVSSPTPTSLVRVLLLMGIKFWQSCHHHTGSGHGHPRCQAESPLPRDRMHQEGEGIDSQVALNVPMIHRRHSLPQLQFRSAPRKRSGCRIIKSVPWAHLSNSSCLAVVGHGHQHMAVEPGRTSTQFGAKLSMIMVHSPHQDH